MIQEQIEILERQYNYLSRQNGISFIRQARSFCSFLRKNAHYSVLIQDMISETQSTIIELEELDSSLMPELVAIRTELQQRAPEYDDSNVTRSTGFVPHTKYESSFAFFDAYLEDEERIRGIPMFPTPYDDRTKFNTLSRIMTGKIYSFMNGYNPTTGAVEEGKERKDLEDLRVRLVKLQQKHDHKFRGFLDAKFSLPGVSWINLEAIFNDINPEPTEYDEQDLERMLERTLHSPGRILRKALYEPEPQLSDTDKQSLSELEKRIRAHCERVQLALI